MNRTLLGAALTVTAAAPASAHGVLTGHGPAVPAAPIHVKHWTLAQGRREIVIG